MKLGSLNSFWIALRHSFNQCSFFSGHIFQLEIRHQVNHVLLQVTIALPANDFLKLADEMLMLTLRTVRDILISLLSVQRHLVCTTV
jgi:hypothetical protein